MVREPKSGKRGRGRKERFLRSPPPPPRSIFGSRPIFRAGKIPKIPFLGLSLLPNPTGTLATQATMFHKMKGNLVVFLAVSLSLKYSIQP